MRKIQTREEAEKKSKRNRSIVGAILIVIMIFSVAGYAFFGKSEERKREKITYNEFEFELNEMGLWETQISNQGLMFKNLPNETEGINVPVNMNINSYVNKPLYLSYDDAIAVDEIVQNLRFFVYRMQRACINENCTQDFPIKNCSSDNLIIIKEKEISKIVQEDNCVFILGNNTEIVKVSDAFLYKIFGIRN